VRFKSTWINIKLLSTIIFSFFRSSNELTKGQNKILNFAFEWDYTGLFDEYEFDLNKVAPDDLFELHEKVSN
jgi:hypothetical protein